MAKKIVAAKKLQTFFTILLLAHKKEISAEMSKTKLQTKHAAKIVRNNKGWKNVSKSII
ncbi:MAG: hypothetical protein RR400_00055 [Clostridia bacterium]